MESKRFTRKGMWATLGVALLLGLPACASTPEERPSEQTAPNTAPPSAAPSPSTAGPSEGSDQSVAGTLVHFTTGDVVVEVAIEEDNSVTRSFLAMLPMTLTFSDFGGKEKVATPPGELDYTDAEGLDPIAGDLFSYIPWGNIGFFYTSEGNSFSSSLAKIGSTDDIDQTLLLDGQEVTIAIAN